jgi:preprotein translocase subunit YajC
MRNFLLAETSQDSQWLLILALIAFFVIMLVFSVLPQKRKQKQLAEMSSRIKVGDKVKTVGGIVGNVVDISEDETVFTILSGSSTLEVDRSCVYSMEMLGLSAAEKPQKEPEPVNKVEENLPPAADTTAIAETATESEKKEEGKQ